MTYKDKIINLFKKYAANHSTIEIYDYYHDHENVESLLYYGRDKSNKIKNIDDFYNNIFDAYLDAEFYYIDEYIKDFKSALDLKLQAHLLTHDYILDEIKDIFCDYVSILYPCESFLDDEIKINIFWSQKNKSGYDDTFLSFLLHSQGYKSKDYPLFKNQLKCLHICTSNHLTKKDSQQLESIKSDPFLNSLYDEIYNCYLDSPRDLCFVAKVTIRDYFKLLEKNKKFRINKDVVCGLVDIYNGGGSILGLQLKNDVVVNTNDIYIKIENVDHYTIDDIYGLTSQCFKDCITFDVLSDYQKSKAALEDEAQRYQIYASNHALSYGALAKIQSYFYKKAKRYGLVKTFKENAIVWGHKQWKNINTYLFLMIQNIATIIITK